MFSHNPGFINQLKTFQFMMLATFDITLAVPSPASPQCSQSYNKTSKIYYLFIITTHRKFWCYFSKVCNMTLIPADGVRFPATAAVFS